MFDAIFSVFDRLLKLKQYIDERSEKRFDEVFKPVFDDLMLIHLDYVKMFDRLNVSVSVLASDEKEENIKTLVAAADELRTRRIELEPLRIKLRAYSKELRKRDLDQEALGFVSAVESYFDPSDILSWSNFQPSGVGSVSLDVLMRLEELIEQGTLDRLHEHLLKDAVKAFALALYEGGCERRVRWAFVCEAFARLQIAYSPQIR